MNFNERIWKMCKKVPKGKVTTYKELAKAVGTKAYRAVGNAMRTNPYAPEVPCHRVVDSRGHLRGFAHGLKVKAKLLRKEGVKIKNNKTENFEKVLYRFKQ
ncbi:MGMT family protein [Candidatus Woesearchaeota archaeon]|nr:MGMT family protein [Candidatus Woesearchaeota archaeon]